MPLQPAIVPPLQTGVLPGLPAPEPLEEAGADRPQDLAAAMAFALMRTAAAAGDGRPLMLAATAAWLNERGRPFGWSLQALGLGHDRVILARPAREIEVLWALEEALKSGAVCAAIGAVEAPSFLATRRLDFAARAGGARACLLRACPQEDLSAARLRWRIAAAPSAPHPLDPRAPGAARIEARLTRSRTGASGAFTLEQDHETHGWRLAARLADHGLAAGQGLARSA